MACETRSNEVTRTEDGGHCAEGRPIAVGHGWDACEMGVPRHHEQERK
jgi:hypothetical protein